MANATSRLQLIKKTLESGGHIMYALGSTVADALTQILYSLKHFHANVQHILIKTICVILIFICMANATSRLQLKTIYKAKAAVTEVNAAFVSLGRASHDGANIQQL